MKQLKIHNFGPIQEVDILFKKYNFLIGGQGVGKSTKDFEKLRLASIQPGDVFLGELEALFQNGGI